MSISVGELVKSVQASREYFFKHLDGLTAEQWDWKPYPECKSARETLGHIIVDDMAARQSLETRQEPDYDTISEHEMQPEGLADLEALKQRLTDSHQVLCGYILEHWASAPLEAEACIWGTMRPLAKGIPYLSSEDYYHAGQIAFIRMATDPSWDYYAAIYG